MRSSLRTFSALVAVALLFASGCGGDDDDSSDDTTTTTAADDATTEASESTEAEETTEATEASSDSTEAAGEDITEPVTAAYTTFFDGFSGDLSLLQDGDQFSDALAGLQASAAEQESIGVTVHSVTALDDAACDTAGVGLSPCAEVNFDLVVNGEAAVPDQTGYAVYQDDTWKVSATTFCALTALGSGAPEAC